MSSLAGLTHVVQLRLRRSGWQTVAAFNCAGAAKVYCDCQLSESKYRVVAVTARAVFHAQVETASMEQIEQKVVEHELAIFEIFRTLSAHIDKTVGYNPSDHNFRDFVDLYSAASEP